MKRKFLLFVLILVFAVFNSVFAADKKDKKKTKLTLQGATDWSESINGVQYRFVDNFEPKDKRDGIEFVNNNNYRVEVKYTLDWFGDKKTLLPCRLELSKNKTPGYLQTATVVKETILYGNIEVNPLKSIENSQGRSRIIFK